VGPYHPMPTRAPHPDPNTQAPIPRPQHPDPTPRPHAQAPHSSSKRPDRPRQSPPGVALAMRNKNLGCPGMFGVCLGSWHRSRTGIEARPATGGAALLGRSLHEAAGCRNRAGVTPARAGAARGLVLAIRVAFASRREPCTVLEPVQGLLKPRPPSSVDEQRTIALWAPPVRG